MPTVDFQLTLNRRELASILAGLRLLQCSAGAGKILPYAMCRMVDDISSDAGAIGPLTDAEVGELVRRLMADDQDDHGPDYSPDVMLQTCPSCGKRVTVEEWDDFAGICAGCAEAIHYTRRVRNGNEVTNKRRHH